MQVFSAIRSLSLSDPRYLTSKMEALDLAEARSEVVSAPPADARRPASPASAPTARSPAPAAAPVAPAPALTPARLEALTLAAGDSSASPAAPAADAALADGSHAPPPTTKADEAEVADDLEEQFDMDESDDEH